MSVFKKIYSWTFSYKFCKFIQQGYYWIKDLKTVGKTLYSDEFKKLIKQYLNVELKEDWIGRLYGVANPDLNKDGKFDINNTILEIDDGNTNNSDQQKQFQSFIFKQLNLIGNLFKLDSLYDYITFSLTHVGPVNADNYLLVFDLVSRKDMCYYFKRMLYMLIAYVIIFGIILIFII